MDQDTPNVPPPPPEAPEPPSEPAPPPPPPPSQVGGVEEGKTFAILCYALSLIGLPFFIIPLITRDNEFSLYHAKQTLMLWLAGIAATVVGTILSFACIGVIVFLVAALGLLVLDIIGLINAVNGVAKPLPVVGALAEEWFKGLTVKSA